MSKVVITDRPMSEYEAALFDAVVILGKQLLRMGASETDLLAELKESQERAKGDGRLNEAATFGLLVKLLCEPPVYYVPNGPPSK